jgi:hypothetical protein
MNRARASRIARETLAKLADQRFKSFVESYTVNPSRFAGKSDQEIRDEVLHTVWHWLHFVSDLRLYEKYELKERSKASKARVRRAHRIANELIEG